MKILLVNKYFYLKGGSETAFFDTAQILAENGHQVIFFSMHHPQNEATPYAPYFINQIDYDSPLPLYKKIKSAAGILHSREAKFKINQLIEVEKPDIVHLHNIHSQISPSILIPLKKHQLPVVMTLHDYKMVCPAYTLWIRGRVCEKCAGGRFYQCILNKCIKNSFAKSLVAAAEMYLHHRLQHIYQGIDAFISPSHFLRSKLTDMGFQGKLYHLPNPVFPPPPSGGKPERKPLVIYTGRLSREKGLGTLLSAFKSMDISGLIIGEGDQKAMLKQRIEREGIQNIKLCGYTTKPEMQRIRERASLVAVPSEWYENCPYAVTEAFAAGKPVAGSHIGGIPELIEEEKTGMTFPPGDCQALQKILEELQLKPEKFRQMGKNAERFAENHLNPQRYYEKLMNIYERAVKEHA